jgi:NADH dehydrogenase FAD-containing subunit
MDSDYFCIIWENLMNLSHNYRMYRRNFIQQLSAGLLLGTSSSQALAANLGKANGLPRVIIVGAGFGGLTVAKYLRQFSQNKIEVLLIDPSPSFVSSPMSNLIFSDQFNLQQITFSRHAMVKKYGIRYIQNSVSRIDPEQQNIFLSSGERFNYDRLVVSPGISYLFDDYSGIQDKKNGTGIVHAMQAGPQTLQLKKSLEAMTNGGVFAITIPVAPYRCPPSPYERACQVGLYFKKHQPKSKILILDANPDVTSKSLLFKKVWANHFPQMIEYRNNHTLMDVDPQDGRLIFEVQDDITADVLNVIPPMRAGDIAHTSGLTNINRRWCGIDFLTCESTAISKIHVLGDATQGADLMPKSAQIAYGQGKACAHTLTEILLSQTLKHQPHYDNLCYSFMTESTAAHIKTDHRYDESRKTMSVIQGSQELSSAPTTEDFKQGVKWAKDIWQDILT